MSAGAVSEPQISGKVVLKTTLGDIEIELWAKETPLATRNFIQLCLEGYYDGCIFNRVIKDFIAQTGDPTGTGTGGESIYPPTDFGLDDEKVKSTGFKDEFHSRLRFNRRGMVGMASSLPDCNKSQFFFTLAKAENLTKKHTVFGRIAGDTLFNLLKINDIEVDSETDLPLFPPKIISADVVWNPFNDIVPRVKKNDTSTKKQAKKKPIKKDLNLLSFGDEEVNNENEFNEKIFINNNSNSSSNSNVEKKKEIKNNNNNNNDNLENNYNNNNNNNLNNIDNNLNQNDKDKDYINNDKESGGGGSNSGLKRKIESDNDSDSDNNNNNNDIPVKTTTTTITSIVKKPNHSTEKKKKIKGSLQFKTTSTSGSTKKSRPISETDILSKLNSFKTNLSNKSKTSTPTNTTKSDGDNDDNNDDWMGHSLKFSKRSKLEYE